jgi:hypothetical protein
MDELDFSIKCYELCMIMHQNDMKFIHTLNKFRMTFHTQIDINMLNNTCLQTPPNDSKIPHLFSTNKSTYAHSDTTFKKIIQTFIFKTIHIFHGLMPSTNHYNKKTLIKVQDYIIYDKSKKICSSNYVREIM